MRSLIRKTQKPNRTRLGSVVGGAVAGAQVEAGMQILHSCGYSSGAARPRFAGSVSASRVTPAALAIGVEPGIVRTCDLVRRG